MFNGDRLNDEYETHQRRFAHITKDELEILVADAVYIVHVGITESWLKSEMV